jgi:hypothetical protein
MKRSLAGMLVKRASVATALAVLALSFSGCGTTRLEVSHSPLTGQAARRDGAILVKAFSDVREADQREYIGNKRNGYGMVLGHFATNEGVHLETLLAGYFVEALQRAGYNAVLQQPGAGANDAACDAVLEGEITEFWLDAYMKTWNNVEVKLTLKDKSGAQVLWQRDIKGSQSNVLWIGASGEFEKVIRESLDVAMDQAVKEFSSPEFQSAVKKSVAPPAH